MTGRVGHDRADTEKSVFPDFGGEGLLAELGHWKSMSERAGSMSEVNPASTGHRILTGPRVVAAMFLMGICGTAFLYGYWTLHMMPFMPLQEAIVAEFPGSSPRVDGGRKKMQTDTPTLLHIVMKSQVDPTGTDAESAEAMAALRKRIAELVAAKVDFPAMNYIELHVYQLVQEKEIREKSWRLDLVPDSNWREIDEPMK